MTHPTASQSAATKKIYLAGGCFWGVEAYFQSVDGVVEAVSGYANGKTENPRYEDLIYHNSGHAVFSSSLFILIYSSASEYNFAKSHIISLSLLTAFFR